MARPLKVSRRGDVAPFIVMDVMREANARERAGQAVVHLEVGQPGTPAPRRVLAAARGILESDRLGYSDSLGIQDLRARIARHYGEVHGVALNPDRVVVTAGSSAAFVLSFLAAFDPGDRVALASPGYPAYRNILAALGIQATDLPTGPESNYQPDAEALDRVAGPLHGLIVASPSNPTGTMVEPGAFRALSRYCRDRGVRLISDEIYHGITYGTAATTAAALDPDAVVVNSFSKYFSMTGWRLGWMVAPEDLLRPVERLAQNLYIAPSTLAQRASLAAFDCRDELDGHVARYDRNRRILAAGLPEAGFDRLTEAQGAFYMYADVGALTRDAPAFCRRMLAEAGVAVTPGVDFDRSRGARYVRFSFAGSEADMKEAVRRLKAWRGA